MGCWQLETPEEWKVRANSGSLRGTQEIRGDGQKSGQRPRKSDWFPRQVALPVLQIRKWRERKSRLHNVCMWVFVCPSVHLSIHSSNKLSFASEGGYVCTTFVQSSLPKVGIWRVEYQHSYGDQDDGRALFQGDKVEDGRTGHCCLN